MGYPTLNQIMNYQFKNLKSNKEYDLCDVLNDSCFFQNNYDFESRMFRDKIITIKNFPEYNDVNKNQKQFKITGKISTKRYLDTKKPQIKRILFNK